MTAPATRWTDVPDPIARSARPPRTGSPETRAQAPPLWPWVVGLALVVNAVALFLVVTAVGLRGFS